MEQNGNLLLNLKVHVHDVQKADDDVIKDNVYSALSVFGEVDICHFKKAPYDEIYENDAEIILTLAIGSRMNYDDDLHRNILSFDISEKDLEEQLSKCGLYCTVAVIDEDWCVA